MTRDLDKDTLLRRADKAISLALDIIENLQTNEAGDALEFMGSMNDRDAAMEAIDHYKGYLITGQK